ncbi:DinB family protein [Streptomyces sp. NBC_00654]|uniref:DinB family protein n=1 Tax=Streptomyces sp. NBC_00654 TaxID=2975799 RepID=UPI00225B40BF|nr:DinB family protein [Streptomyces sp. NBC_00654]MCX4969455.1 DinB family protein [Streptomyces sp. NBC_00654]
MTVPERAMPPLEADERVSLETWLDFYRATLAQKCDGLGEDQLREASSEPSPITLLGLVRHMAEVERNWFRRVLAQEDAPPIFPEEPGAETGAGAESGAGITGDDGGFVLGEGATYGTALTVWQTEIRRARENCAARALDDTSPFMGGRVTLRWIYTHMIGEYARHCGHADIVRERIDGRTGV